jgi:hypothetical protein
MGVHDIACVSFLEEGHAGADRYSSPPPARAGPRRRRFASRRRFKTGRGRERVRALLEMQVRPDEEGAGARVFFWRPRRYGAPSAAWGAAHRKILGLMPEGAS